MSPGVSETLAARWLTNTGRLLSSSTALIALEWTLGLRMVMSSPGTTGESTPGGARSEHEAEVMAQATRRFRVRALTDDDEESRWVPKPRKPGDDDRVEPHDPETAPESESEKVPISRDVRWNAMVGGIVEKGRGNATCLNNFKRGGNEVGETRVTR